MKRHKRILLTVIAMSGNLDKEMIETISKSKHLSKGLKQKKKK